MSGFKKHNVLINEYAQQSPENLQDMVMMVVLSIQQPWYKVGEQMIDYRKLGSDSRFVWGNKLKTYRWLRPMLNHCMMMPCKRLQITRVEN